MSNSLVSVVLATYNGEKYLKEQIYSILHQTYPNMELIVTDDCSTDGTWGLLEEYADKFKNVHIYRNVRNLGLIKNFEKAAILAKGDFIAFADQDDIWLLNKIQLQIDSIGDNMLVYCDSEYVDADGKLMNKKLSDYRNYLNGRNLYALDEDSGIWVAGHAALFRKELLEQAIPFTPYINHDAWIAYVAMLKGTIKAMPEVLVLYRQHDNNIVGGLGCHNMRIDKSKKPHDDKKEILKGKLGRIDALLAIAPESEPEFRYFLEKSKKYLLNATFLNKLKRMFFRLKYATKIYAPRKRNYIRRAFKVIRSF